MTFPEIVIAGCGNPLFADDGFGPVVAEELYRRIRSDRIMVVDAGTSAPQFLFPLLDPGITRKIIIIDTTDFGGRPGTLIRLGTKEIGSGVLGDSHAGGIIAALRTISRRFDITIIGCQPGRVTDPVPEIGLSPEVQQAVPRAADLVIGLLAAGSPPPGSHCPGLPGICAAAPWHTGQCRTACRTG